MDFGRGHSIDSISKLPDEVLCHILSFLPTKYAVRTSLLSTRWKYLYASVPSLDFDDSLFSPRQAGSGNLASEMQLLMSIVDRTFVLRKLGYIDRFSLKCRQNIDVSSVNIWIYAALWRNIRELDFCVSLNEFTQLPGDLFACPTLVVLKLSGNFVINLPIKICLPNLKILHLNGNSFPNEDSIQRFISSCPVLEDLAMSRCLLDNIRIFNISAPTLKSLTIDFFRKYTDLKYKFVLNTPKLVYLKYSGSLVEGYLMKNLQSLVESCIDVRCHLSFMFSEDETKYFVELLCGIAKVKFLYLSGHVTQDPWVYLPVLSPPTLCNLTRLELGVIGYGFTGRGLAFLVCLLECSPILETLAFVEGFFDPNCNPERHRHDLPHIVPPCMMFHLKMIKIMSYRGYKIELKLAEYFLKNSTVLRKMTIQTSGMTDKDVLEVSKKLMTVPRGSKECVVSMF